MLYASNLTCLYPIPECLGSLNMLVLGSREVCFFQHGIVFCSMYISHIYIYVIEPCLGLFGISNKCATNVVTYRSLCSWINFISDEKSGIVGPHALLILIKLPHMDCKNSCNNSLSVSSRLLCNMTLWLLPL